MEWYAINAICERVTSLRQTLSERKVKELRELARSYYVSGYSRMKKADAEKTVTLIHFACQIGAPPQAAASILPDSGKEISERQIAEVTGIIQRMFDTTRLPVHNGHTPAEIRALEAEAKPARQPERQRIGRNAPCPCGSGRKYKKCCGR